MAGYQSDEAELQIGPIQLQSKTSLQTAGAGPCMAIMTIAKDFQDLIRETCPRCGNGTGSCLVEQMRAAAWDAGAD